MVQLELQLNIGRPIAGKADAVSWVCPEQPSWGCFRDMQIVVEAQCERCDCRLVGRACDTPRVGTEDPRPGCSPSPWR